MLIELSRPLPVYIPEFDKEGYAFALESNGMENYLIFHIIVDGSGEIWSLDNTRVRGCINYTAGRPFINKELRSVHLDKLKKDAFRPPEGLHTEAKVQKANPKANTPKGY